MELRVRRISKDAILPAYAHPGDAGLDLCSTRAVVIEPGRVELIPTGIAIELPENTEAQVRPRSGLAKNHAITVLNSPGTIDEGYRGEVQVLLINHGREPFEVKPGMRIAQLVVMPRLTVSVVEVETLGDTRRGAGGYGSTGS